VDWERERVDVVVDEVSMEPGLLRNTCSSGIRDKDMKSEPALWSLYSEERRK
jgi:hypothetical protein